MGLREDILDLAASSSGGPPRGDPDTDFLGAFGMEGDDATEFLELFEARYENSLDGLLWYFHFNADEPPTYRRMIAVDREGKPIPLIPITLGGLVRAAEDGKWPIVYPPHSVRTSPVARVIQAAIGLVLLGLLAAVALRPLF